VEHLQHFGLSEDPFRNEPRLRECIDTATGRDALARLERGLRQARGLLVLAGELGSGKTLVVRQLLEKLEEEVFEASMLVVLNGAADTGWMLTRFAKQLGVEEPEAEREALLGQVYERLAIIREDGRHAVLIIDDAHLLASGPTLGEVCGLLKLEYEERRLFSLVLAGEEMLDDAILCDPTLAHRVEVRVRMGALDAAGAAEYLAQRVRQAGGQPAILDADAVAALHRLGHGLPGRMNTLADNALFAAFLCGRDRVARADVERAHADLGWGSVGGAPPPAPEPPPAEIQLTTPVAASAQADPGASIDAALFASPGSPGTPPPRGSAMAEATIAMSSPSDGAPELEILDGGGLSDLDSDLEAIFEDATGKSGSPPPATQLLDAPPKEEEDLVVELLDD
jgi:type II secretory pathway predicted ATPase ExeA